MPDPQIWSVTSKKGWPKLAVYASQSCHSVVIHPPCGDLGRLQPAMPDLDELVRNISVEPL